MKILCTHDYNIPFGSIISEYNYKGKILKGYIRTMPFEEYLCYVVSKEISASYPPESIKAQAVSARSVAEKYINNPAHELFNVTDDSNYHQAFNMMRRNDIIDNAIKATKGEVLRYKNEPLNEILFSASNGGKTRVNNPYRSWNVERFPYYQERIDYYDKTSFNESSPHGYGMSQTGAYYRGKAGHTYKQILSFYYVGCTIEKVKIIENDFEIRQCILTENDCYKQGIPITPCGIFVHDTGAGNPWLSRYLPYTDEIIGNKYSAHWNQSGISKCVHGFIGKGVDGDVYTYQTLPFDMKGWHAGGTANKLGYIGFEMCDDGYNDKSYFNKVYKQALQFCEYLCRLYNIKTKDVIGHYEGHQLGIASNHADPKRWFDKFGKSMDMFRQELAIRLGETNMVIIAKRNDKNDVVKDIQEKLIKLNSKYETLLGKWGADSDYGGATENAVEAFKKDYNLGSDGSYMSDVDYESLNDVLNPPTEPEPPTEEPDEPANENPDVDIAYIKSELEAIQAQINNLIEYIKP